ncbi:MULTISPECIES: hypothetical protein [Methylobacterium]|jgi:hypothetical protein|uniref:hypothetical protein n=1 Tax=Methylobacterium TaxID=407 RepID=UPI0008DEFC6B|nr:MULTISPECIES: hypothetical protein [Methylobacterium]MBZ6415361.1 hypothetical protein [Methylobacterium sp.]MBK3397638.1 hypothetical protein [Methylobacterium ajmalii]MBK3412507.1 hypothetical protein [Methylobacterium ajmalii]MBK3426758.1 hypothetical protein [Methylobacterium ajmalii]SFF67948.1 hypothetical protein SAMN04487844_13729 [Methylobacterium sp. yr596]
MATRHSTAPARAGERGPARCSLPVTSQPPKARSYFSSHGYKRADRQPLQGLDVSDQIDPWDTIFGASATRPDTPHVRALRFLNSTGELLSAVILVAGTIAGYGVLHPF